MIVASKEELTDLTEVDAAGLKVLPGFIDVHSHGAKGHDFSDADVDGLKKSFSTRNLRELLPTVLHL